jgi:hypothetical protein
VVAPVDARNFVVVRADEDDVLRAGAEEVRVERLAPREPAVPGDRLIL